jgi:hypothetical protein
MTAVSADSKRPLKSGRFALWRTCSPSIAPPSPSELLKTGGATTRTGSVHIREQQTRSLLRNRLDMKTPPYVYPQRRRQLLPHDRGFDFMIELPQLLEYDIANQVQLGHRQRVLRLGRSRDEERDLKRGAPDAMEFQLLVADA